MTKNLKESVRGLSQTVVWADQCEFLKPYLTQHCLFVLGKNRPKDFSVSNDGSKAHTSGDTTWNTSGLKYVLGYG